MHIIQTIKSKNVFHSILIYICFLLISAYLPISAHAENADKANTAKEPQYGVAMHDAPELKSAQQHLPYVNPDAPKGGQVKQAAIGTYDNLNPFNIKGISAARGLNLIYDRLTLRSWNEPFTLYPLIAEKIKFSDDRLNISITLNPNARFSDNSKITSEDVEFSFNTLKKHGRPNMRNVYKLVDEFKIIDTHKISIKLNDSSNREAAMIIAMMPVLSKAYWSEKNFNESLTTIPVTNGPYTIKDFEIGRKITYQRNKNYWAKDLPIVQGLYNFDKVTFDYYRDDDVALLAFNAGDLNYRREGNITKWVTGYEKQNAEKKNITQKEVIHGRPDKAKSLIYNTRRPPFDDIGTRKALFSLMDFNWVNENLFHNKKKRSISFFPNSKFSSTGAATDEEMALLAGYQGSVPVSIIKETLKSPNHQNKQLIRKHYKFADYLLRQAGWIIQDGKRVNEDTKEPFTFEVLVNNPDDEKLALAFSRSLKRLGITPTIRRVDSATYQGRMREYNFDMAINHWTTSLSPGTEQFLYWGCDAAKTPSQWNYSGVCNPAVEHLLNQIVNTTTRDDLRLHMRLLDRILTHMHIAIPLFHLNKDYVAYTDDLAFPDKTALYGVVIESWWEKQKN